MKKSGIVKLIMNFKYKAIFCIISAVIQSVTLIMAPIVIGNIIDEIIMRSSILNDILILVFIYILNMIAALKLNQNAYYISCKISKKLRSELYDKVNKIKLQEIDKVSNGDILNLFSADVENVAYGISQLIITVISGIASMIGILILMYKMNVIMATLVLLSAPIAYITSKFITKNSKKYYKERAKLTANLNGYTENIINNHKLIKDFNYEENAINRFKNINSKLNNIGVKAQFYSSLANPVSRLVNNISYILIGITGVILSKTGEFTLGNLSTFLLYTNTFARPFNEITAIISEIQICNASYSRITEFLNKEDEYSVQNDAKINGGEVEFKDIEFSYVPGKKFITDFNLNVKDHEKIAIVGKTGAGKTTIVNLLMRFYDINKGSILIDGIPIQNIPLDVLRRNIGMVLQDTKLFMGTIRENIAYGKENATYEEIVEAAKLAHADKFIQRLPHGYDTFISNEEMFSKGEVQLLTIARVMLLKPRIVILDEATSNVDLETEKLVQNAFEKLMVNATSFVIAHRLETIKNADRIIYIENGNIVEQGTHEELIKLNGKYSKMNYK